MEFHGARLRRRIAGSSSILAFTLASLSTLATARAENVLPTQARTVTPGAVSIKTSGANLTVNQSAQRAIVNWTSFSVGANNSVTFSQPNAASAILNRVTGSTPSAIAGRINANGQVYLVNPNGVAITPTGAVKVGGGFVASTLAIRNSDFNNGALNFVRVGGSQAVSNAGSIVAASGGFVGLLGANVSNSSVISVPLGKVALGSGERATLNLTGDNFLQVAAPANAATVDGRALIDVSGKVRAANGVVQIKAATAANAIREAVNISGFVSARSARASGGSIILGGGAGGNVSLTGRLSASGRAQGGAVRLAGRNIALNGAKILARSAQGSGGSVTLAARSAVRLAATDVDVSGASGGGAIRIGGAPHAAANRLQPRITSINRASALDADATADGKGGSVTLWSNNLTTLAGLITARGGPNGGDGGAVETSSGGQLAIGQSAAVRAGAPQGQAGSWLLDPFDLTIDASAANAISAALNSGANVTAQTTAAGTDGPGQATSGIGDVNVDAAISWNGSATLTLSAYNNINVNAPITATGAGQLALTNDNASASPEAALNFAMGQGRVAFTGGSAAGAGLTINGQAYTLLYNLRAPDDGVQSMNGSSGYFALAQSLDASQTKIFKASPVQSFSGTFNGLGNTISNLTIASNAPYAGLFGLFSGRGVIANIGLVGGSVTDTVNNAFDGGLIGYNQGAAIKSVYTTMAITGALSGYVGGLVGYDQGNIAGSYATGAVTGGANSFAGGLVGFLTGARITDSYATGAVFGRKRVYAGGLVGWNFSGAIATSYANGSVNGGVASVVGGLVGMSDNNGAITDVYATGPVRGGRGADVGGLAGADENGAAITDAYAIGAVSGGPGASLGGLVGVGFLDTIVNAYWDVKTTGQKSSHGGAPLTTAQLRAALPTFVNPGQWGIVAGKSYPYLCFEVGGCPVAPLPIIVTATGGGFNIAAPDNFAAADYAEINCAVEDERQPLSERSDCANMPSKDIVLTFANGEPVGPAPIWRPSPD